MKPHDRQTASDYTHRLIGTAAAALVANTGILVYRILENHAIPHALAAQLLLSVLGLICLALGLVKTTGRPSKRSALAESNIAYLQQPAVTVNRQGQICSSNDAAAQLTGQAPTFLIGKRVHDWFHPGGPEEADCVLCQHISSGHELPATDFIFGTREWQQISLSNIPDSSQNQMLELHSDISAHKQVEQRLALVIDGAELGYWDWNYVTGKHQVNQRWLDMLGLQADELDNYVSDWDHRLHPEDRDRVRNLIQAHIASGKPYVVEFRMKHKDGHWVWIQGSGSVVENDPVTGEPIRLCGIHQNITARKSFENNLHMAYQVISQSPSVALIWDCSEDLQITFATANVKAILGYTLEQLQSGHISYLNLIYPDDIEVFRQELEHCRNDIHRGDIVHQPYRIIAADGNVKWLQDHKVISRNEQGKITGFQGLISDITRQRQQNSAIRNIISSSFEKTADTALDNFSQLALETLGADYILIGEMESEHNCKILSFRTLHESDMLIPYHAHRSVCQYIASGKLSCLNPSAYLNFPEDAWLRQRQIEGIIGVPWKDEAQQAAGYVLALYRRHIPDSQFAQDILKLFAAQITSELARNRALLALEFQKQRLLNAQAISRIGDWQWHWSDNHFSWSDEMYRITGTQRNSFIPDFANFLTQLVHPDDRNLFKTSLQNSHYSGSLDFRHRIVLKNGEIRHVFQRGKIIRNSQQRATGIQGTMQDVTERLQAEQRLLEAKQEAEKANQIKSEFLANMSHEIRTPMNAIVGLVDLVMAGTLSSKQRDYLERVETAAHGLMKLIDDILDFSKMESGKLRLTPVPFLLNDMLDQVFSTMTELCRRKNLQLIHPQSFPVDQALVGDPQRLRQILINLIGNAIKFTERGHVEIGIEQLQRSERDTTLEFRITDTGIGMSEQQQTRLFKAFSQGDSSITRNYGGTGLGLVICKQLVEQMGGQIRVMSEPGTGSCFSFTATFGIAELANTHPANVQSDRYFDTHRLQKISGARILLVEDNEVNRIVAHELLTQARLQVDTAENGEIALAKLKNQHYDCILMDIQMPVMDGYAATHMLRTMEGCLDLPVIAMTANVMNADRQKCLAAGMNDFIGKPILPHTLYSTLAKWIKPTAASATLQGNSETYEIPYLYGIDSKIGLLHTAGDKKVYQKILQKFAENHADTTREIVDALASGQVDTARQLTHTVKGLAGSLGAITLQGQLQRMEEILAEYGTNSENTSAFDRLIELTQTELMHLIESINSSLPVFQSPSGVRHNFSETEIQQQLTILLDKLKAYDSDADQQLDLIFSGIHDESLINALLAIRKKIAHYQFLEAAQDLAPLIDNSDS